MTGQNPRAGAAPEAAATQAVALAPKPETAAGGNGEESREQLGRRVGSARRLQALALGGHSTAVVSARLSVSRMRAYWLRTAAVSVSLAEAAAIKSLYDELWDVRGPSDWTARMAVRQCWAPAMAWDDNPEDPHFIDNPAAGPVGCRPAAVLAARRAS